MESSLHFLQIVLVGLAIFLITTLIGFISGIPALKKAGIVGIIGAIIGSAIPLADLATQDWRIPECRDQNGRLIEDDQQCEYP